jgi:ribonuclease Z
MRPSFLPRLVNGPFHDPALFIPFVFENRAILFDIGEIYSLSSRDILKISHVFVSHTHMDHFSGFDRLLRLCLGREKTLFLFGPKGVIDNVSGKLSGYTWNLAQSYLNHFAIQVTEIEKNGLKTVQFLCRDQFVMKNKPVAEPFSEILLKEPSLSVHTTILDHGIPCLGFSLNEEFHINIIRDHVFALGLDIGPWLKQFKQAVYDRLDPDSVFEVKYAPRFGKEDSGNSAMERKTFRLGELTEKIAVITPGQKISYIADVGYTESNAAKIIELVKGSDHLFVEAAFLDEDRENALEKNHLTARQAGTIAGRAGVKQFTIFHFSPRYTGKEELLQQEAAEAFQTEYKTDQ